MSSLQKNNKSAPRALGRKRINNRQIKKEHGQTKDYTIKVAAYDRQKKKKKQEREETLSARKQSMPLAGAGRPQHARSEARRPPRYPGPAGRRGSRTAQGNKRQHKSAKAQIGKQMANKAEAFLTLSFGFFMYTNKTSYDRGERARGRNRSDVHFHGEKCFSFPA